MDVADFVAKNGVGRFDRQAWLKNLASKRCDCGRKDIVKRHGTDFICARCARLEEEHQIFVVGKPAPALGIVVEEVEVKKAPVKHPGFGAWAMVAERLAELEVVCG